MTLSLTWNRHPNRSTAASPGRTGFPATARRRSFVGHLPAHRGFFSNVVLGIRRSDGLCCRRAKGNRQHEKQNIESTQCLHSLLRQASKPIPPVQSLSVRSPYRTSILPFSLLLLVAALLLIVGDWHFVSDVLAGTFVGVSVGILAGEVWLAHSQ